MAYEVRLDSDECMSAGRCVTSALGFFVFDDDEIATIDPSCAQPDDAELLKVARTCPSRAIKLFDGAHEVDI
jgi:ferredoxin